VEADRRKEGSVGLKSDKKGVVDVEIGGRRGEKSHRSGGRRRGSAIMYTRKGSSESREVRRRER